VDWILGGHSISGRGITVVGRWSFVVRDQRSAAPFIQRKLTNDQRLATNDRFTYD
jgi:hypothetical protein